MPRRPFLSATPLVIAGLLGAGAVRADADAAGPTAAPFDRWSFSVGAFRPVTDTTIHARAGVAGYSADGSFNLEDDLGLRQHDPVVHARFDVLTRPSQQFSLDWFAYGRENEVSISRAINYEGRTYEASARVLGRIDYDFARAAYRWWHGDGATAWGIGAGVAWYRVDTLLEGEATFEDESVYAAARSSDAAFAPLLTLGWRHAVSENWRLYAELSGVAKEGGALHGHIVDGIVGVEWWPWRRVGLALEYGHTKIRLVREREYYDARLAMTLKGPTLFLRLR